MKREIFCRSCGLASDTIRGDQTVSALEAGLASHEKVVKVYGVLACSAVCDFCGIGLNPKDAACCRTIVPMGGCYYSWEDDYLVTGGAKPTVTMADLLLRELEVKR